MMARARDTQKEKLYRAERCIHPDSADNTIGSGSVAEVTGFLAKVLQSAVVRRNYPTAPTTFTVKDGRGRRRAGATKRYITLPAGWGRKKLVVLHELAHVINGLEAERERIDRMNRAAVEATASGTNYWRPDFQKRRKEIETCNPRASHGWQFAAILLNLVRWFLGKDFERELKAAFRKNHVRFAPKKQLTEAQRVAAAERLRAIRMRALPVAAKEAP